MFQVAYRRVFRSDFDDRLANVGLGERDEPRQRSGAAIRSSVFGGAKSFNGFIKVRYCRSLVTGFRVAVVRLSGV